jgi:hypothetical protein
VCVGQPTKSCFLDVTEPGFVHLAAPVTDGVSTAMVRHMPPGRFCMSGRLDPGATNANWGAILILALSEVTRTDGTPTGITAPFPAASRHIAQLQFTLDPVPPAGLGVQFAQVQMANCLDIPACVTTQPFVLMEDGSTPTVIQTAGTVTASLDSFHQPPWGDPALPFDKDLIAGVQFQPQVVPNVVLDYDFCVQDVTFLDSAGAAVSP